MINSDKPLSLAIVGNKGAIKEYPMAEKKFKQKSKKITLFIFVIVKVYGIK